MADADSPLLRTDSLTKRFGSLAAVDDVEYTIERGEFASIIGPNGAGKTTFFNLITGEYQPTEGTIFLDDEEITPLKPHERVGRGLGRVFQITNVFPELSTFENVRLAVQARLVDGWGVLRDPEEDDAVLAETEELLEDVDLVHRRDVEAKNLSHGDKRRLEIALALALDPQLLLLDEPLAGLTQEELEEIKSFIMEVAEEYTILLVEHKIDVVMELSDRVSVLHQGRLIAEGTAAEIQANDQVKNVYLGEEE